MNRPKFQPIFLKKSDFCEKSSSKAIETLVPGQAIRLSELVSRFERGQRLNVHANFPAGDNFDRITDEEALQRVQHESMDDMFFPPTDVHDCVDVEREMELQKIHKLEFSERMKKKKAPQAPQAPTPGEAQPAQPANSHTPEDPAK